MQPDSYDIPAYKFGIVFPRSQRDTNSFENNFNAIFNTNNVIIVPFENFDGLTLLEVKETVGATSFAFICYTEWHNPIIDKNKITVFQTTICSSEYVRDNGEEQIDKTFEKWLTDILLDDNSTIIQKRVARCFFQRYQDKSFQKTEERLTQLNQGKK